MQRMTKSDCAYILTLQISIAELLDCRCLKTSGGDFLPLHTALFPFSREREERGGAEIGENSD